MYGRQYTPNYSAAITELLIRAGYDGSAQVEKAMRWLLSMRQDDGGWAIPTRTLGLSLDVMLTARETFEPDRSRPSSHLVTGIVVRALAAHPGYRHSADTRRAADLLKSRFFRRDVYPDRAAPSNWLIFSYPFWWTDLLSALDSLARIGFGAGDPDIARGVAWFTGNQDPAACGIPGTTGPRAPTATCGSGSPSCRMLNAVWADEKGRSKAASRRHLQLPLMGIGRRPGVPLTRVAVQTVQLCIAP